ncbi:MAG: cyclic nucleotide-binding domain-containing protein, partial [Ignavibacteriaceae bacterium]|nr:cyclic nucleotide-binding domain-containing protein [Ignavibacteriaceae bacterium]
MNMENQLFTTLKLNRLCKNVNFSKIHLGDIKGQIISIREGEVLFREGDSADSIFLIVSGEINVIKKKLLGKTKSYIYTENTFLGQEDFLEEMSRTSIAVALRDSYLISLSKEEIERLMAQDINIAQNLNEPIFEFEEDNVNRDSETAEYEKEDYKPETQSEISYKDESDTQSKISYKDEPKKVVLTKSDFSSEAEIEQTGNFEFKEVKKKSEVGEDSNAGGKIDIGSDAKVSVKSDVGTDSKIGIKPEVSNDYNPNTITNESDNESNLLATFDHDFLTGLIP